MFIDRQMIKYLMPADEAMDALGIYGAVAKLGRHSVVVYPDVSVCGRTFLPGQF